LRVQDVSQANGAELPSRCVTCGNVSLPIGTVRSVNALVGFARHRGSAALIGLPASFVVKSAFWKENARMFRLSALRARLESFVFRGI
jgi:hypothetical protein